MDPTRYVQIQIETTSQTYSAFKWKLRRILLVNTTISLEWTVHNTTVTLRYSAVLSIRVRFIPLPNKQPNGSKTHFSIIGKTAAHRIPPQISKMVKFGTKCSPIRSEALHHRGLFCETRMIILTELSLPVSPPGFSMVFSHVERLWHSVYK